MNLALILLLLSLNDKFIYFDTETKMKPFKFVTRECLCEDMYCLIIGWLVHQIYFTVLYMLLDDVMVHLNLFFLNMEYKILGQFKNTLIIKEQ